MASLRRRLRNVPGVAKAQHVMERATAPYLRADLSALHSTLLELVDRVERLESAQQELCRRVDEIDALQPAVLNAVASTNGTARILRRETDALRASVEELLKSTEGEHIG